MLVMGVVNVTPDSFSDGYPSAEAAIAHGRQLAADGADILDVGGEATNPRATAIDADEELRRVLPVLRGLVATGKRLSIDTTKAEVARAAVRVGASIVNDVSGGLFDDDMARVVRDENVTYVAGHLRGRSLDEVFRAEVPLGWEVVAEELAARIDGLPADRVWVDPGIGFGKGGDGRGNFELLRHTNDLRRRLGCPLVVGPSRKRFLQRMNVDLDAASVTACLASNADVVRIHNVALLRPALIAYTIK